MFIVVYLLYPGHLTQVYHTKLNLSYFLSNTSHPLVFLGQSPWPEVLRFT